MGNLSIGEVMPFVLLKIALFNSAFKPYPKGVFSGV